MSNFFGGSMFVILFLAMVSCAGDMTCDTSKCPMSECLRYAYIGGGIAYVNPGKLNDGLNANNISSFNNHDGTITLGGHRAIRRTIWESELSLSGGNRNFDGNLQTDLMTAGLIWNSGFNIVPAALPIDAFPFVGIGIGANALHFHNQSQTLANALATDEPDAWLWQAKFLLNLGLGADYIFKAPDGKKGLVGGIRIGYLIDPYNKTKWRNNGYPISDLSALSRSGFFARIVIGGWKAHEGWKKDGQCRMNKEKTPAQP